MTLFLLEQAPAGGQTMQSLIMFGLMIAVFYFFMIRPQRQKQKKANAFKESLTVGQKIVTIGGIHGKILELDDKTALIQSEGSKLRIEKIAISMEFTPKKEETQIEK